ncbi:MAG: hypothetical protein PHN82_11900 [bacterium]|nr:hypothetical protein [bacterium]
MHGRTRPAIMLAAALALPPPLPAGDDVPGGFLVRWSEDATTLRFSAPGEGGEYPRDMERGPFPQPGATPEFLVDSRWPAVAMRARWSVPTAGWPARHRGNAIDIALMHACDAELYENIFPEIIRSSRFTYPPAFLGEALDPAGHDLAAALRGGEAEYEVVASAGPGASDYLIRTRIRVGAAADGRTVFFHDRPLHISDHLLSREILFAVRDAGDRLDFEARMIAVCAPRLLFRGETMRRVEENGRYFVRRLRESLGAPPSGERIDRFLESVRAGGGR